MSVAIARRPMSKRNDTSVKIDTDAVADARIAAAFKGQTLAEYISIVVGEAAKRDIEEGYRQRSQPENRSSKR